MDALEEEVAEEGDGHGRLSMSRRKILDAIWEIGLGVQLADQRKNCECSINGSHSQASSQSLV